MDFFSFFTFCFCSFPLSANFLYFSVNDRAYCKVKIFLNDFNDINYIREVSSVFCFCLED